jgi:predicted HTH transcriptional regulator
MVTIKGKTVLSVKVLSGSNKPYYIRSLGPEKGVFIRIGSSTRLASEDIVLDLQRQKRGIPYTLELDFQYDVGDIESEATNYFFNSIGQKYAGMESLLHWNIAGRNNGDILPTVTGLILFGKKSLSHYDYANLRLTRFQGITTTNIMESREYSLPISNKIDALCTDITTFLGKESYFDGPRRIERTIIPFFAIREAVVNAIVHRDYSITGSSIKINVFDDRMEIISPGTLFGNLDIADLGTGLSECRNRSLVRIFRQLGLMEELGTGIARINELYIKRNLQAPLYQEQGNFFKTTLWQKKILADVKEEIEDIVISMGPTTAKEVANKLNIHHNTVLKYLKKLLSENKVKRKGSGRKTVYVPSDG